MSNSLRWAASIRSGARGEALRSQRLFSHRRSTGYSAVAATALVQPGHGGKIYGVTGGESLTPQQCASILSRELGIELNYVELSDEEALSAYVGLFWRLYPPKCGRSFARCGAGGVLPWQKTRTTVQDVLGRPPRTFSQWAAANAAAFQVNAPMTRSRTSSTPMHTSTVTCTIVQMRLPLFLETIWKRERNRVKPQRHRLRIGLAGLGAASTHILRAMDAYKNME